MFYVKVTNSQKTLKKYNKKLSLKILVVKKVVILLKWVYLNKTLTLKNKR